MSEVPDLLLRVHNILDKAVILMHWELHLCYFSACV